MLGLGSADDNTTTARATDDGTAISYAITPSHLRPVLDTLAGEANMDCSGSLSAGILGVSERGESRSTEISRVDDRRAEQKGLGTGQEEPRREAAWNQALESHPTSRLADEGPVVFEASVPS
jgi:hypothetical protein